MAVQAAGGLRQLFAAFEDRNGRGCRNVFRLISGGFKEDGQPRGLVSRQLEIRHSNPGVVFVRLLQKRRETAGREFFSNVIERDFLRIVLGRSGRVMTGDAVQRFKEFSPGFNLFGARLFRVLRRWISLQRNQKRSDGFGVLFRFRSMQQFRHARGRTHRFGIGNPTRHPMVITTRAEAFKGRRVHGQFGNSGVGRRTGVTLRAAKLNEQLATEPELTRFLQFRHGVVRQRAERDRFRPEFSGGPEQPNKRVAFRRTGVVKPECIRAFVEPDKFARPGVSSFGARFPDDGVIDFQFQIPGQFSLKCVIVADFRRDEPGPFG